MDLKESLETLGYGRRIFGGEHDEFRRSLRQFFRTQIEPKVRQREEDAFFPHDLYGKAGRAGVLGAAVPEQYGGASGDFLHMAILFEEHGYSVAGAAMEAGLTSDVASLAILDSGKEAQKRQWLPKFAQAK